MTEVNEASAPEASTTGHEASAPAPYPTAPDAAPAKAAAKQAAPNSWWRSASLWVFLIAGTTLVNGLLWATSISKTRLVLGLFAPRIATKLLAHTGALGIIAEVLLVAFASVLFLLLGLRVRGGDRMSLVAVLVLYSADSALLVSKMGFHDPVTIGIHAFALWVMVKALTTPFAPGATGAAAVLQPAPGAAE